MMTHLQFTTKDLSHLTARQFCAHVDRKYDRLKKLTLLSAIHRVSAEIARESAPDPIEPPVIEDIEIPQWEIEANAGPTLVNISVDTSGDDQRGYIGEVVCYDVEADILGPDEWRSA